MDEITITTETHVAELKDGGIIEYAIDPEEFGMKLGSVEALRAHDPDEAKDRLLAVLDNTHGAARDIVALNAGAAIYVGGMTQTLEAGVKKALYVIASGEAKAKLEQLIAFSNRFKAVSLA
jgi:anthranilate phosphoribosyltransferase